MLSMASEDLLRTLGGLLTWSIRLHIKSVWSYFRGAKMIWMPDIGRMKQMRRTLNRIGCSVPFFFSFSPSFEVQTFANFHGNAAGSRFRLIAVILYTKYLVYPSRRMKVEEVQ